MSLVEYTGDTMNDKAKTIFISSTFEDLKNHRRNIWDLLGAYDVNIRGMEKFGARKEAPLATCLSEVEQCDVFLAIIAFRLGSIDDASGKSFTQREYERALELKKEILIYLADEKDSRISPQDMEFDERRQKLIAFKSILRERHTIDTFISEDDLAQKVKRRFDELLTQKEEVKPTGEDEYSQSKELIDKFLLLPKVYSGHEVKLEVNFVGQPFPASKLLCSSFNLGYGETIGVSIEIKKPEFKQDAIPYVFIAEDTLSDYFALKQRNNVEIYGRLQFSENKIGNIRANFERQVYHVSSIATTSSFWSYQNPLIETKIVEADGTVILRLTKILSK
jgi:hypothetical protein